MKITGTRSYILVQFDYRTIKIAGELTMTPAFYADIDSIKNWEPPYENMEVTDEERKEIIRQVIEFNNPDFPVVFE